MVGVLEGFTIIAVVVGVGYLVARLDILPPNSGLALNKFAFFVALPPLMFVTMAHADLHVIFSARLPIAVLSFSVVALLYALIARFLLKKGAGRVTVGAASSGYINANNMGLPVATYIVGDAAQVAPILLFQLLIAAPVVLTILDTVSTGRRPSLTTVMSQPVKNPLIIGSALGLLVNVAGLTPPDIVLEPLRILGGAGVPLILAAFGMSLRGSRLLDTPGQKLETILAASIKNVLMPLLAYLLAQFVFGLDAQEVFAAAVLAALPSAQNMYNFAVRYNVAVGLSRDIVLLSTIGAVPVILVISLLLA
ncbi:AEC family transporter [Rothia endophytica]|uniref:AEC family transporter n=1 Tax=Rothia endophytica TaxID=1324766 RepID=UPI001F426CF4|nr:AEC family transporter [Rothia endophytica]